MFVGERVHRTSVFGIVADLGTKRILLVHNRPHPGDGKPYGWGPPGGKAERDEKPEAAIFREIYQETGIETQDEPQLVLTRPKNPHHTVHVFFALPKNDKQELIIREEDEVDKVGWFTLQEIIAMPHIPFDSSMQDPEKNYIYMTQREWIIDGLDNLGLLEFFGYKTDDETTVPDPAAS